MIVIVRVGVLSILALCAIATIALAKGERNIRIIVTSVALLRSPDYDGEVIRKAQAGDTFVAVSDHKGFYLVKDGATESFLWIPSEAVEVTGEAPSRKILISGKMPMPTKEDLSYWQVVPTDRYKGGGDGGGTLLRTRAKDGYRTAANGKKYPAGYDYNTSYRARVDGRQMVQDAMEYLGAPYVLGGTTTKGVDCSGLTQKCLANQGINVVHRASLQALEGRYVHHDDLQPGDLVFFRDSDDDRYLSHVGIYAGRGKFVHASQSSGGVVVTSLSSKYFKSHYAFARRL